MRRIETALVLAMVVTLSFSCGKGEKKDDGSKSGASSSAAGTATASVPASKGRDLSKLKAIEIVTPEEVATLAGGKIIRETAWTGSAGMYVVELPDGAAESYNLRFESAETMETLLRATSDAEKGEKVSGLWDEAYVGPRALGSGFHLWVLRRGDMALELGGERKEVLIEMAKKAISRLE